MQSASDAQGPSGGGGRVEAVRRGPLVEPVSDLAEGLGSFEQPSAAMSAVVTATRSNMAPCYAERYLDVQATRPVACRRDLAIHHLTRGGSPCVRLDAATLGREGSNMAKTGEECTRAGTYNGTCEVRKHQDTAQFTGATSTLLAPSAEASTSLEVPS